MKQFTGLSLAMLLTTAAHAQRSTIINDPMDTGVVTQYFTVCPSTVTNTYTMPNTITVCPGNNCNGGKPPVITAPPSGGRPPWVQPNRGSEILAFTTTGADGKVTELHEYITVYDQWCTESGWQQATWTITQECPCSTRPTMAPDFTTTVVKCGSCGPKGESTSVTLTQPCSTGAYATVTPDVGPGAYPGQPGSAGHSAPGNGDMGSGSGAGAGNGNGSGSGNKDGSGNSNGNGNANSNGSGSGSDAGDGSAPGSGSGSAWQSGAGSNSNMDSHQDMGSGTGMTGNSADKTAGGDMDMGSSPSNTANMPEAGMNNTTWPSMSTGGSMTKPSASTYTGGAERFTFVASTLIVAVIGSLTCLL